MSEIVPFPDSVSSLHKEGAPGSRGFVFATTGASYTVLARRAARSLRQVMPRAQIDLFTDQKIEDEVFDQIHPLTHSWFRPKMEAMRRSRFERTVMLDADVMVLCDVSELFEMLERYEMAGVHGSDRHRAMLVPEPGLPRCAPVINSGVMALRRTPRVTALLEEWERQVREGGHSLDQPVLRKLLYHSDVRFLSLPQEYNLIYLGALDSWRAKSGAPRILHITDLHKRPPGNPRHPLRLDQVLSKPRARHVRNLMKADWGLGGSLDHPAPTPMTQLRRQSMGRWQVRLRNRLRPWRDRLRSVGF